MPGELTSFAAEQQCVFDASTSAEERKKRGHFGTPAAIAEFMAGMFSKLPFQNARVLDPGAGVGMLSAAVCQQVLRADASCRLDFELWENDPKLAARLNSTMNRCQRVLHAAGHEMSFIIRTEDFILANRQKSLFEDGPSASFHLAIMNPPYFKLRKDSPHALAMRHVVHGQPNIYALFMAVATDLLTPGAEIVAITPRSYFNGSYFRQFRRWFFERAAVRHIHVFESRSDAFKEDAVLQENVIIKAEKGAEPTAITLTTSAGRDLCQIDVSTVPYAEVIDQSAGDCVIRVATNRAEHELIKAMDRLPNRFRDLGLEISTGPVVTFRSSEFLRTSRADDTAPLLWMHNVRPFKVQFPSKNGKPTHIHVSQASKRLLVPAKTYVLLKRFSAKEEHRRLVAAVFSANDSYSDWVGLENHLNYVYRKSMDLSEDEARGLAAFFNSALVDRYFRAISGNTQVNATEIRGMPIPDSDTLIELGKHDRSMEWTQDELERAVGQALRLPASLLGELSEVARDGRSFAEPASRCRVAPRQASRRAAL